MQKLPKEDKVLGHLLRINRLRIRHLRRHLAPYGYTGIMHLIVFYTHRHPGCSQEDITAFYALDKTSVARDARKLEDLGHLTRRQDPDNRRQYQLELTAAGLEMAATLAAIHDDYDRKLSQDISPEDWSSLKSLLEMVEKNACRESAGI